jgi:hypothetical protein
MQVLKNSTLHMTTQNGKYDFMLYWCYTYHSPLITNNSCTTIADWSCLGAVCPLARSKPRLTWPSYSTRWPTRTACSRRVTSRTQRSVRSWSSGQAYAVVDYANSAVVAQIVPATPADLELRTVYGGSSATAMSWLVFAADVPAMGYTTYTILYGSTAELGQKGVTIAVSSTITEVPLEAHHSSKRKHVRAGSSESGQVADQQVTNGLVTVTISGETGLLTHINSTSSISIPISQNLLWYNASVGNDVGTFKPMQLFHCCHYPSLSQCDRLFRRRCFHF